MDTYSTGEELVLKARKPYTITKQRERWTEEEHNRFLDALKLYGRAWQRIEEHIGTKTAVQIRSHAQKFFSKLEKEAVVIGVQPGQTLDIDIPPPRPKRKPSYPYPRKSNTSSCTTSLPVEVKNGEVLKLASSMHCGKEMPEFKTELPSKTPVGIDNSARGKVLEEENCSEVIITSQTASCVSFVSANRSSIPSPVVPKMILEFLPLTKEVPQNDDDIMADDIRKLEADSNHKIDGADPGFSDLDNSSMSEDLTLKISNHNPHEKLVMENSTENLKQTEKPGHVSTNEMQANQSYPEHVPVHTVGMSSGPDMNSSSSMYSLGAQGNPYLFIRPENSSNTSMSSVHQTLPPFLPPSATLPNNETCASFPNLSPTFPCLLMPSLLQDPAAHMAATLSASLQPNPNGETTVNSSAGPFGRFQPGQMSPTPNLAAIAAATVAAASAWWAAHGLLPLCSSSQTGLLCPPPFSATPMDIDQAPPVENSKLQDHSPESCPCGVQELGPEQSEATKRQPPGSKVFKISSSDSAKDGGTRSDSMKSKSAGEKQDKGSAPLIVLHDSVKSKFSKKVDRSSCGSNSCSSSEVETDALKTRKKVTGELEEPDVSSQDDELNIHCSGSTGTANESWKEVSQEGRSAFRALFRREILPQSFSPPPDPKNAIKDPKTINIEGNQYIDEKDEDILQLNLYCNSQGTNPNPNPYPPELLNSKNTEQLGFLSMGLGHGKFKSRRTGFKPYKRCSTEANEVRMANEVDQCEEKCPKRICIIGEPSTL